MEKRISDSLENGHIIAEVLGDEIEQALDAKRGPSAEELAAMPVERIVCK